MDKDADFWFSAKRLLGNCPSPGALYDPRSVEIFAQWRVPPQGAPQRPGPSPPRTDCALSFVAKLATNRKALVGLGRSKVGDPLPCSAFRTLLTAPKTRKNRHLISILSVHGLPVAYRLGSGFGGEALLGVGLIVCCAAPRVVDQFPGRRIIALDRGARRAVLL